MKYTAKLYRRPIGLTGIFELCRAHESPIYKEALIGSKQHDTEYGGVIPEGSWLVREEITFRKHPDTHKKMDMARLIPMGNEQWFAHYYKRSFMSYPFMIHRAGTSTGCIAIKLARNNWAAFVTKFNAALAYNQSVGYAGIVIEVI